MFKLTFIMSLMILGVIVWADEPTDDCDACGEECKPLCGTKRFRLCCHNYMRRRRSAEANMDLASLAEGNANLPYSLDSMVRHLEDAAEHADSRDNLAMRFF